MIHVTLFELQLELVVEKRFLTLKTTCSPVINSIFWCVDRCFTKSFLNPCHKHEGATTSQVYGLKHNQPKLSHSYINGQAGVSIHDGVVKCTKVLKEDIKAIKQISTAYVILTQIYNNNTDTVTRTL